MKSEPWTDDELKELSDYIKKRKEAAIASQNGKAKHKITNKVVSNV